MEIKQIKEWLTEKETGIQFNPIMINHSGDLFYSVRRISDGKIFELGNFVTYIPIPYYGQFSIKKFYEDRIHLEDFTGQMFEINNVELIYPEIEGRAYTLRS